MIEGPLKPTQTKNQLRNVKVKQLYITLCDVQTQHVKIFQHFAVTHVEKMLRLSNRRGWPAHAPFNGFVSTGRAARSDTMEGVDLVLRPLCVRFT